jgi:chemotaxis protein MotB
VTRRPSQSRAPSHDRWLVSYADFITLLFAFFATMYAVSSVDAQKLSKVARGLQTAFDDSARRRSIRGDAGLMPELGRDLVGGPDRDQAPDLVKRDLAPEIDAGRVVLSLDRRGLVVSIPEAGLFALGSDDLAPPAQELIARLGATLGKLPNAVRVEGHTDDLPIHTVRFRSNWDLSTARATRVIAFLVDHGLDPQRLSAAGYAEFHPRTANTSASARAQNRRVDLVILNGATVRAEEPSEPRR